MFSYDTVHTCNILML